MPTPSPQQAHDQGQTDRGNDTGYNPPFGTWDHVTAVSVERQAEITSVNGAYNAGYTHTGEQIKSSN